MNCNIVCIDAIFAAFNIMYDLFYGIILQTD